MAYEKRRISGPGTPQGETRESECRNLKHKTFKVDFHGPKQISHFFLVFLMLIFCY